jgi:dTDP-4-dehydrorhamnose 3,5-epimerase
VKFLPTDLPGPLLVEREVRGDERGFLIETFHAERYAAAGIAGPFVLDLQTRSRRGILRGLHFQEPQPQGKLVEAVTGAIFDVIVDVRRRSPSFGRWASFELTADNRRQLWVPPGFAHGFCVLSDVADVLYKLTGPFVPAAARHLLWNDPALAIPWPIQDPVLSPRDRDALVLAEQPLLPE